MSKRCFHRPTVMVDCEPIKVRFLIPFISFMRFLIPFKFYFLKVNIQTAEQFYEKQTLGPELRMQRYDQRCLQVYSVYV